MQKLRPITLVTVIFIACSPWLWSQDTYASSNGAIRRGFGNLFVDFGGGYASLPKRLVQFGDSSVTDVPYARGFEESCGIGTRLGRRVRIQFNYQHERVIGNGHFAQNSSDPHNVGANGNFAIGTGSKMVVIEADIFHFHRLTFFAAGGGGKTSVSHHVKGASDPVMFFDPESSTLATIVVPVADYGRDPIWDATLGVGARFPIKKNLELSCGVYGRDSVNARCSVIVFPSHVIARMFGR